MERAHVNFPVSKPNGDLLTYLHLTIVVPGTQIPSSVPVFATKTSIVPMTNPVTLTPGIVDLWTEDPQRFDLLFSGPDGFTAVIPGVDLTPDPEEVISLASDVDFPGYLIDDVPTVGDALLSTGWGSPNLVAPHDHDGALAGSTVLDPSAHAADAYPNQTWVGYNSDTTTGDTTGGSALGANVEARGLDAVAVGSTALADGDQSTVVGFGSTGSGNNSVVLGPSLTEAGAGAVTVAALADTGTPTSVDATSVTVRQFIETATASEVGNAMATPAPPGGVTNPLWILGDLLASGVLRLNDDALIGGATTDVVGFYAEAGSAQPTVDGTGATGALASLLTALESYGLINVTP